MSCIISYGRLSSPWLKEQRRKGEKCLEIRYIHNKPYVYDRATRSPKKVSTCISHLAKGAGLIPKGSHLLAQGGQGVWVFSLMAEGFGDLLP